MRADEFFENLKKKFPKNIPKKKGDTIGEIKDMIMENFFEILGEQYKLEKAKGEINSGPLALNRTIGAHIALTIPLMELHAKLVCPDHALKAVKVLHEDLQEIIDNGFDNQGEK